MHRPTWKIAALLFGSGMCALIYQTTWLRQFRLIFGASTFATAAVLAIFMGGLGIGSALLGKRADRHPNPLKFYGNLELLIAGSAALSPLLLWIVAKVYIALGGSVNLGLTLATVVRLILATLVLAAPTVLMGGTLPAAARAAETADDRGRRKLALLYAANTLGAVTGALIATFYLLETFGNRQTLFLAVLVNALVAMVARHLAGGEASGVGGQASEVEPAIHRERLTPDASVPPRVVLAAAGLVGFAFLLMELVWYRMLGPILGGTTFMFGLILAIALLGIGLGGAAYSFWSGTRAVGAGAFALTCTLEAAFVILPFALGDRLAIIANLLRSLGRLGFEGHVIAWVLMTSVIVLPAAFIAGVQFPLLIALLGRGREDVGRHVGAAYAWNTGGAIAGSLAGGFGLLPLLSATGSWRLVAILLALLGLVAVYFAMRDRQRGFAIASAITALLAIAGTFAHGPTALWRHSGIGAGRAPDPPTINEQRDWVNLLRRALVWEVDGRESSLGLMSSDDVSFVVNGKSDGSARSDAGTQVMSGMVGALIHPNPRRAMVIGLGTGTTAGWLGSIQSMTRVDVVELEPAVVRVAEFCAPVNQNVLKNPKVSVFIGDAREVLLTTDERYDVIFSEPSNPYRAGIASLFTKEFYEEAAHRLNRGGLFAQWVQAYEIDAGTIATIYGTLQKVFPHVDTWRTTSGDLLLLASKEPIVYDAALIARRARQEPFASAIHHTWRVETAVGFLSHFVASDKLAKEIAAQDPEINTDDRTLIEFGFARTLGVRSRFNVDDLVKLAYARGAARPTHIRGAVDWNLVMANVAANSLMNPLPDNPPLEMQLRRNLNIYTDRLDFAAGLEAWRTQRWRPVNSGELAKIAAVLAEAGDEEAFGLIESLRPAQATEADAILARLRFRQQRYLEAADALERALIRYRSDPWPMPPVMERALDTAEQLVASDRSLGPRMLAVTDRPYVVRQQEEARKLTRLTIAYATTGCSPTTIDALRATEPNPLWRQVHLELRARCYAAAGLRDLAERARRDYAEYLAAEPAPLLR